MAIKIHESKFYNLFYYLKLTPLNKRSRFDSNWLVKNYFSCLDHWLLTDSMLFPYMSLNISVMFPLNPINRKISEISLPCSCIFQWSLTRSVHTCTFFFDWELEDSVAEDAFSCFLSEWNPFHRTGM